jgi:hypothetical protein
MDRPVLEAAGAFMVTPAPVEELVEYVPAWLEAKGHPELAKLWREELAKASAAVNATALEGILEPIGPPHLAELKIHRECTVCHGRGRGSNGRPCHYCGGTGKVKISNDG